MSVEMLELCVELGVTAEECHFDFYSVDCVEHPELELDFA
jgi:hypothetical protein